jgi:hypothetical protein
MIELLSAPPANAETFHLMDCQLDWTVVREAHLMSVGDLG